MCACTTAHGWEPGQHMGAVSLSLPYGSWSSNSRHQAQQQALYKMSSLAGPNLFCYIHAKKNLISKARNLRQQTLPREHMLKTQRRKNYPKSKNSLTQSLFLSTPTLLELPNLTSTCLANWPVVWKQVGEHVSPCTGRFLLASVKKIIAEPKMIKTQQNKIRKHNIAVSVNKSASIYGESTQQSKIPRL